MSRVEKANILQVSQVTTSGSTPRTSACWTMAATEAPVGPAVVVLRARSILAHGTGLARAVLAGLWPAGVRSWARAAWKVARFVTELPFRSLPQSVAPMKVCREANEPAPPKMRSPANGSGGWGAPRRSVDFDTLLAGCLGLLSFHQSWVIFKGVDKGLQITGPAASSCHPRRRSCSLRQPQEGAAAPRIWVGPLPVVPRTVHSKALKERPRSGVVVMARVDACGAQIGHYGRRR